MTDEEQIAVNERQIAERRVLYDKLVAEGQMTRAQADRVLAIMEAAGEWFRRTAKGVKP